jgi:hypothetical protein
VSVFVWVLVVSSWNSTRNMAEVHGPYADLESCQRVQQSRPLAHFETQCVQVKVLRQDSERK